MYKIFLLVPLFITGCVSHNLFVLNPEKEDWKKDLSVREEKNWGDQNFALIKDNEKKEKVLRVSYPARSASPNVTKVYKAPVGGAEFLAETGKYDSIYFQYSVKFEEGFDFVKGGKLPGLFGGTANSGGMIPTGHDGFSTRFMWREYGKGELYVYMPSSQQWGTPVGAGSWNFIPGKWHTVQHYLKLNDSLLNNGKITIWIDQKLVHQEDSLLLRKTSKLKISGIFFSTFFGGNDTTWAASKDSHIYFDKFILSDRRIK